MNGTELMRRIHGFTDSLCCISIGSKIPKIRMTSLSADRFPEIGHFPDN